MIMVKNETIISKMMDELQEAKKYQHDTSKMTRHIENIHLLSGLMIEDKEEKKLEKQGVSQEISDQEMQAMMGRQAKQMQINQLSKAYSNVEKETSGSLFDF